MITVRTMYMHQRNKSGNVFIILSPSFFCVAALIMAKPAVVAKTIIIPDKYPKLELLSAKSSFNVSLNPVGFSRLMKRANSIGIFPKPCITANASFKPFALKNIHAKVTRQNVKKIFMKEGSLIFSNKGFDVLPAHWYSPCRSPQITKFQVEPCQIPLTKKVMSRLR